MCGPGARPLEEFRSYLRLVARAHLPAWIRRHVDESDVVQQTLFEAHRGAADFRGKTEGEQAAWLRRILARNLSDAIRDLRRARRDVARERSMEDLLARSSARIDAWLAAETAGPARRAEEQERVLRLTAALERLPEGQRSAVVLRHLHGASLPEIAEQMEVTRAAAAGLLRRGLGALRDELEPEA